MPEEVIVCQKNGQWGFLLECGDFITQYRGTYGNECLADGCSKQSFGKGFCRIHYLELYRRFKVKEKFVSVEQVLSAISGIMQGYQQEYGDVLPWRVRVE